MIIENHPQRMNFFLIAGVAIMGSKIKEGYFYSDLKLFPLHNMMPSWLVWYNESKAINNYTESQCQQFFAQKIKFLPPKSAFLFHKIGFLAQTGLHNQQKLPNKTKTHNKKRRKTPKIKLHNPKSIKTTENLKKNSEKSRKNREIERERRKGTDKGECRRNGRRIRWRRRRKGRSLGSSEAPGGGWIFPAFPF